MAAQRVGSRLGAAPAMRAVRSLLASRIDATEPSIWCWNEVGELFQHHDLLQRRVLSDQVEDASLVVHQGIEAVDVYGRVGLGAASNDSTALLG